jgi:hypothetical protein
VRKLKLLSIFTAATLALTTLSISNASALTFGCKKAQNDASSYLSSAFSMQEAEINYLRKGMYQPAFSSFQAAHKWYSTWKSIVYKSPKCFQKDNYISRVNNALRRYKDNLTMASIYGNDVAARNNYGSPDPCFKYLGEDNNYLACSLAQN